MSTDYTSAFVRQRRSLIIVSVMLAALLYFGLQGSEVRVGPGGGSGLMVDVMDHRYIYAGLAILWVWWLIRYFQFFWKVREDKLRELRADQLPYIEKLVRPIFDDRATRTLHAAVAKDFKPEAKISLTGVQPDGGIRRYGWRRVSCWYTGIGSASIGTSSSGAVPAREQLDIVGSELKRLLVRATFWPTLRHVYFTEYVFPILVALLPLAMIAVRWQVIICDGNPSTSTNLVPY